MSHERSDSAFSTGSDAAPEGPIVVSVFSAQAYDINFFNSQLQALKAPVSFRFHDASLGLNTVALAQGSQAVCVFVNDVCNAPVLEELSNMGVHTIALRCAGYNNVDLSKAMALNMTVTHVPAYSPYAVAEHAVALIMALNRKIYRVYNRVREGNFSLERLPWGFDMHGRTIGVLGTGKIGECFVRIMRGFGCKVYAYDPFPRQDLVTSGLIDGYMERIEDVLAVADIVSMHLPLTPSTYHLIDDKKLLAMKPGAMLINTSRGALIDTKAVIAALKSKHLGALGIDVYEEEGKHFFHDLSDVVIEDDVLTRLTTFTNVLITPHQAFFTRDALEQISRTTITSLTDLHNDRSKNPSNFILHNGQAKPGFVIEKTVTDKKLGRAYSFTGKTAGYVEEELSHPPLCA